MSVTHYCLVFLETAVSTGPLKAVGSGNLLILTDNTFIQQLGHGFWGLTTSPCRWPCWHKLANATQTDKGTPNAIRVLQL